MVLENRKSEEVKNLEKERHYEEALRYLPKVVDSYFSIDFHKRNWEKLKSL